MKCPKCQSDESKVVDSRQAENAIRRRRECEACHNRFTTFERIEEMPLLVIKKDDTREIFNRDKIITGIVRSARKRPVSSESIEKAVERVERKIRMLSENEVRSEIVGEFVMEELADLDEITYVRFASVYRSFKDVSDLEELLRNITNKNK
ncbi:transcriptional regulator NrdR [Lactococcus paracarnosus]|uniref:Transcriptional repressor NrdR n=1 Tax=Pseudolactococcus paracarnosus TaxID=2749962 RepID=A0A7L4WEA3_9LACT|nr:transcriptional regulator NrdR [Lactococcus paracarnosus]SPC36280.1 negative regulator of transcription of ribonucleotide reductase nrd genes and operons [Lactococcus piscium]MCJ1978295.1 transcriptional repressor NrdR [Lactococcus paracarnosus]MCJ1984438.1 transcriptional repressor NrdR [Lactococcus paracarnosus]MCJ1994978.1 transcriptional repressor NrdR [Lactococcus paracarnosus]MCJ1998882.1 transcriptional repressor NrdR [Lactococcus paracarnosus]